MVLGPGRIPQFEVVSWALWWTGATMRKKKRKCVAAERLKRRLCCSDHLYQEGQPAQRGSWFLSYFPQPIRFGYVLHFWRGILQQNIVSGAGRQRTSRFQRCSFLHCFHWKFKYTFQPKCKCFLFVFILLSLYGYSVCVAVQWLLGLEPYLTFIFVFSAEVVLKQSNNEKVKCKKYQAMHIKFDGLYS